MNDQNLKRLIEELKEEGSLEKEAEDLAFLSKNLSNLYSFKRSNSFKTKFLEQDMVEKNRYFKSKQMFATAIFSLILLFGFTSIVNAQNSLPGDNLYPIKKLSENIISSINPSFKSEILKRRSEEIKRLSDKKDYTNFHNAVKDYEKQLSETKKINTQNINETKKNLQDAQKVSLEENKKDIENAIIQTKKKQEEIEIKDVKGDSVTPIQNRIKSGEENKVQNPLEDK